MKSILSELNIPEISGDIANGIATVSGAVSISSDFESKILEMYRCAEVMTSLFEMMSLAK